MNVGVVIASYGDEGHWAPLRKRALESVQRQSVGVRCNSVHWANPGDMSLGALRNAAALDLLDEGVDRLIFLDADDELDKDYVKNISKIDADIVQPATLGIRSDGVEDGEAILLKEKPLLEGNYIVIGAMLNAELFQRVGGFGDQPIYEDWDLWLRMSNAGARIGKCKDAIYRVHVNEGGRNSNAAIQREWYDKIRNANKG